MFCPNCKREVGAKRAFDLNAIGATVLIGTVVFVILFLVFPCLAMAPAVIAFGFILHAWQSAPLECPLCRTRLVNPLAGEVAPAYKSIEEANQAGPVAKGTCRTCRTVNAADASYCSKCGKKLLSGCSRVNRVGGKTYWGLHRRWAVGKTRLVYMKVGAVAILDALGFKGKWMKFPACEILAKLEHLQDMVMQFVPKIETRVDLPGDFPASVVHTATFAFYPIPLS